MNHHRRHFLPLTAALLAVFAVACGDERDEPNAPIGLTAVSPDDLFAGLAHKSFLLVNVHVPREGEIPGTDAHIAFTDPDAIADLVGPELGTDTVLYCKTNGMVEAVGPELLDRGYSSIRYLEGGMNGWVAAGYELDP